MSTQVLSFEDLWLLQEYHKDMNLETTQMPPACALCAKAKTPLNSTVFVECRAHAPILADGMGRAVWLEVRADSYCAEYYPNQELYSQLMALKLGWRD